MKKLLIAVAFGLAAGSAQAQTPGSAQCQADLGRAGRLIENVAQRDRAGPIADRGRLCQTLRFNRSDMAQAATVMQRCLTGHARGENVGQIVASLGDVDAAIARLCR